MVGQLSSKYVNMQQSIPIVMSVQDDVDTPAVQRSRKEFLDALVNHCVLG